VVAVEVQSEIAVESVQEEEQQQVVVDENQQQEDGEAA